VFVTLNESRGKPVETALTALEIDADGLMKEEAAHWADLEDAQLQLTTPDPQINRALGWAEAAVHQAWVCNPDLGCGFVGGYGPSHAGRRPQYDWFFAGDGLVAAQQRSTLATGRMPGRSSNSFSVIATHKLE